MTSDPYLENLLGSHLIERQHLQPVVQQLVGERGTTEIPGYELGERLVVEGVLTPWQHRQLLEGRPDGFFMDRYKLLSHLGSGAMGDVYLAEHMQMCRRVALKVLPKRLVDDEAHLARFYQESRATAALSHPNIVQAYDVGYDPNVHAHFLVMEYVDGQDLEKLLAAQGRLHCNQAAEYIRQTALGLGHAHQRGMVHRDVKPNNLLITKDGVVKILDMGIARMIGQEDRDSLTLAGGEGLMGTVDFLSPEQMMNPHGVDGRADIYSLGCTLFYLVVGKAPFAQGALAQRMMAHQIQPPPDIRELRPDLPVQLAEICMKMLAKKPEHRYQKAEEVADALQEWLDLDETSADLRVRTSQTSIGGGTILGGLSVRSHLAARQAVLNELVGDKVITDYQFDVLSGRASDPLQLRDYSLLEKMSSGRLAGMFRGRHQKDHTVACLKVTRLTGSEEDRKRLEQGFQHEAQISLQLRHPNVVRTFEMGKDGDMLFIAQENLAGRSLFEYLSLEGRPSVAEGCRIIREAALGLAHLHEREIIHRSISPANLWLQQDGTVKILDMSLARFTMQYLQTRTLEDLSARSENDDVLGAPDYMAPEQAIDCVDVTPVADIYGLGCTLYHVLTGRVPFSSANATKLMLKHASQQAIPPSAFNPTIPHELDEFVLLMMNKVPEQRVRKAAIVAQALEHFSHSL